MRNFVDQKVECGILRFKIIMVKNYLEPHKYGIFHKKME